jgi:hypothetical protein
MLRQCPLDFAENTEPLGGRQIGHMHDQRIEVGPPLRRIDARHRLRVARIGSEAIDRLGRHRDGLARRDQRGRLGDSSAIERANNCGL